MLSIEDTILILREILRRAVKSVEMMKNICEIAEIRELLMIIMQVENKYKEVSDGQVWKKYIILYEKLSN